MRLDCREVPRSSFSLFLKDIWLSSVAGFLPKLSITFQKCLKVTLHSCWPALSAALGQPLELHNPLGVESGASNP